MGKNKALKIVNNVWSKRLATLLECDPPRGHTADIMPLTRKILTRDRNNLKRDICKNGQPVTFPLRIIFTVIICALVSCPGCGSSGSGSSMIHDLGLNNGFLGRDQFPETCLEVQENMRDAGSARVDGIQTLYIDGDEAAPWQAYCRGMRWEEPEEYIMVNPDTNWSSAHMGNASPVLSKFSMLRIDPEELVVDAGDSFGAKTSNWQDVGFADKARRDLPAGFTACASNTTTVATGSIDLRGSGFVFHRDIDSIPFLCATDGATYLINADRARIELHAHSPIDRAWIFAAVDCDCAENDPFVAGHARLEWQLEYSGQ